MLRTALFVLSGNAAASLLLLARNLLVARLIPVADYGIAATFAIVLAAVEMASALGLQQQIVQARDGDDPRLQNGLQGFQLLRGCLSGAALFLLAGPLARFFGIPEVAWAYQVLALVPVLQALTHFDIHRLNRQMRFGPLILTGVVPAVVGLLIIWPLAVWLGDWRVMLFSILAQFMFVVVTSHLVAERRYRISLEGRVMRRALGFGWPILTEGVLLYLIFQGDKLIVGRFMGLEVLALFAMGVTLTLTPMLVLDKTTHNLFLPRLSRIAQEDTAGFAAMGRRVVQMALLSGCLLILAIAVLGPPFVTLLLGEKYSGVIPFMLSLAILSGLRAFRSGPTAISIARGHTSNSMIANLPRALAFFAGWALISQGGSLLQLIWLGITAEIIGCLVAFALIRRRPGVAIRRFWPELVTAALFVGLAGLVALEPRLGGLGLAAMGGIFVVLLVACRSLTALILDKMMARPGATDRDSN